MDTSRLGHLHNNRIDVMKEKHLSLDAHARVGGGCFPSCGHVERLC